MIDQLPQFNTKEEFNPMFTNVVNRRGFFIMSEETFNHFSQEILDRTGGRITFNQWLKKKDYEFIFLDNGSIKITKA